MNVNYPEHTGDAMVQRFRKAKCESVMIEGIIGATKSNRPEGSPLEVDIERAALAVYWSRPLFHYLQNVHII